VKGRAYGGAGEEAARSARAALALALSTQLRLFAPFLPFVTEEVWSWWRAGSVHTAAWPEAGELRSAASEGADPLVLDVTAEVLSQVRRAKTERRLSMRAPVARLAVRDSPDRVAALRRAEGDLRAAGGIETLEIAEGEPASVQVDLASQGSDG
jgi:valyl-tRNA synthetase